jgi:hypothetical protein
MEKALNYLELHKGLRAIFLCICFLIASVSLYMGIGMYLFLPGGIHYRFLDRIFPLFFMLLAVLLDFGIARVMHRQQQRSFWSTFASILAATVVGAILASVAIVREHWLELVKELLRLT